MGIMIWNNGTDGRKILCGRAFNCANWDDLHARQSPFGISCEHEFAQTCSQGIESITAKTKIKVDGLRMQLQAGLFTQLTERVASSVTIEVFVKGQSAFKQSYPIDILAFDQWSGVSVLPEMLSAFVTPNHPVVAPILKRASEILNRWTGNPALDEYQNRNPDRVRKHTKFH